MFQDETHFNTALTATYLLTPTVALDATIGLDNTSARSVSFLPFGNAIDNFTNNAPTGARSLDVTENQNVTLEAKASWNRSFGGRWISAFVVGGQGFVFTSKSEGARTRTSPNRFLK